MIARLLRAPFAPRQPPVARVDHPRLGPLVFNDEREKWFGKLDTPAGTIGFEIGGGHTPDAGLIAHAVDIVDQPSEFMNMVAAFLEKEAQRDARMADQIRHLELESVCLWWPKRPDDGMLYFSGPDEYRLWRCDYRKRTPLGLGFDS